MLLESQPALTGRAARCCKTAHAASARNSLCLQLIAHEAQVTNAEDYNHNDCNAVRTSLDCMRRQHFKFFAARIACSPLEGRHQCCTRAAGATSLSFSSLCLWQAGKARRATEGRHTNVGRPAAPSPKANLQEQPAATSPQCLRQLRPFRDAELQLETLTCSSRPRPAASSSTSGVRCKHLPGRQQHTSPCSSRSGCTPPKAWHRIR